MARTACQQAMLKQLLSSTTLLHAIRRPPSHTLHAALHVCPRLRSLLHDGRLAYQLPAAGHEGKHLCRVQQPVLVPLPGPPCPLPRQRCLPAEALAVSLFGQAPSGRHHLHRHELAVRVLEGAQRRVEEQPVLVRVLVPLVLEHGPFFSFVRHQSLHEPLVRLLYMSREYRLHFCISNRAIVTITAIISMTVEIPHRLLG
mmetsp:Transcript_12239/g.22664  ORF Transcript_12239/g.22664 Transcript_12239/m.22664 type:complete len:200 (+) Transcript_12239:610-1209(+)